MTHDDDSNLQADSPPIVPFDDDIETGDEKNSQTAPPSSASIASCDEKPLPRVTTADQGVTPLPEPPCGKQANSPLASQGRGWDEPGALEQLATRVAAVSRPIDHGVVPIPDASPTTSDDAQLPPTAFKSPQRPPTTANCTQLHQTTADRTALHPGAPNCGAVHTTTYDCTCTGEHHPVLLTTEQMAAALQVSPRTLQSWVNQGVVPAITVGRVRRFNPHRVVAVLERDHGAGPQPEEQSR